MSKTTHFTLMKVYLLLQCKMIFLFDSFAFIVPAVFIHEKRRTNIFWSAAFTAGTAQCSQLFFITTDAVRTERQNLKAKHNLLQNLPEKSPNCFRNEMQLFFEK